jgi:dTDP-4-amino-4,6-dideoxygalactose transaminase
MTNGTERGPAAQAREAGSGSEHIALVRPSLPSLDAYLERLREIWGSRMLSNFSAQAEEFERMIREYTREDNVLATVNCDVGLALAIRALEIPEGGEVILSSFAFNSSPNAVLWNKLEPRFVDVDPATYCLDPDAVEAALSDSTALILGTHVFGHPCDVDRLSALASGSRVPLMFDAAQAFATFLGDRHVSSFGDVSAFSFSGTKIVTAAEGGAVVFRSEEAATRFRYLRGYGFQDDYVTRYLGLNGKISELHAALGCLTVANTEQEVAAREAQIAQYRELLAPLGAVSWQQTVPGVRPTPTYFAVEVSERRDDLAAHLDGLGIQTKQYFRPLHRMPIYDSSAQLPVTERLAQTVLCLPLHTDLSPEAVARVCSAIEQHHLAPARRP